MISLPSASRTDVRPVEAVTAWADMVFLSRGSERGDGTRLRGCPPGAVPADQFGRNDDLVVAAATALDLLEQQVHAGAADGGEVLADRGERRDEVRRLGDVVEADHADVLGHRTARLVQGAQQAQSVLVVGREHRRDLRVGRQRQAPLVSRPGAPVAGDGRRHRRPGVGQRVAPPAVALARLQPRHRAGQVVHGAVAEVEEVAGGRLRSGVLVHADRRSDRLALHDHDGQVPRQVLDGLGQRSVAGDHDEPVHALAAQPFGRLGHRALAGRLQRDDAGEVIGLPRAALDLADHRRGPELGRVEADHAERARPAGGQGTGEGVGPEVQLGRRRQDLGPGLRAHPGVILEDPGHRLVRDPGELGHVPKTGARRVSRVAPFLGLCGHGGDPIYREVPARRFAQTSKATAASSTRPLINMTRSLGAPSRDMPLLITAMMRPPVMAPTTLPTPPCTAAPPMNAAAIESSSKLVPAVGPAWLSRPAKMTPAMAASTPMLTNSRNTTDLVLTPDSRAAWRLPPSAYMCRPKTARVVISVYARTRTVSRMSTTGRFLNRASCTMMNITTNPASTIRRMNTGSGPTFWPYPARAWRARHWVNTMPATPITPTRRVNASAPPSGPRATLPK